MTDPDLDTVLAALDRSAADRRVPVDVLGAAVRAAAGHIPSNDVPSLVLDVIRRGEQAGVWAASTATVVRGSTVLPKSVQLNRPRSHVDRRRPTTEPLRPELAGWAANLALTAPQRELLLAVNRWLKHTDGGKVPIAAAAERAYQLIGDEKAFDATPPRGGATLWREGRLTFELLRCERIATPLTWEPAISALGAPGAVVCVENHATFRTMLRTLRSVASPPWVAVAWVQGRNTAPLRSLPDLPFPVTRLDYLGDLDPAGLEIAMAACAIAESTGVPAGPAVRLWELLVLGRRRTGRRITGEAATRLTSWLPVTVRATAKNVLVAGEAIPQEALRYETLASTLADP